MNDASPLILHASAVAQGTRAVLILGASGSGKSGLALELLAHGAQLISDDRVVLQRGAGGRLMATAPTAIAGMIEARGIGILNTPSVAHAEVVLAVDLDHAPEARMPQLRDITFVDCSVRLIFGREVPNLGLILSLFLQGSIELPGWGSGDG